MWKTITQDTFTYISKVLREQNEGYTYDHTSKKDGMIDVKLSKIQWDQFGL
jgi:hypothetical protein